MMGVLSIENMRSILEERESLPELDEHNVLRLKFEDLNGSYLTPGFRDPNYDGDFYSRNHFLQIFLEIPRDVLIAKGKMWLGGKRNGQSGTWNWLDGRLWDFENWYTKSFYLNPFGSDTQPSNKIGEDCIAYSSVWGWYDEPCNLRYPFICQTSFTAKVARPSISASGDKILSMLGESTSSRSTFKFLWNFKPEQIHQTAAGFKLNWWIEKKNDSRNWWLTNLESLSLQNQSYQDHSRTENYTSPERLTITTNMVNPNNQTNQEELKKNSLGKASMEKNVFFRALPESPKPPP